jgi:cell division protein FtsI (penicillin-binding protein 3)
VTDLTGGSGFGSQQGRPNSLKLRSRLGLIHLSLLVFGVALIARAAYVQLWQGSMWTKRATYEHAMPVPAGAARGPILDAEGEPIVVTREVMQLGIAPREVRDRRALATALVRADVPMPWVRRALDVHDSWFVLPTRLLPGAATPALGIVGVYGTLVPERVDLGLPGLAAIVGHVNDVGVGTDGIEAALDSVLRGDTTQAVVLRDAVGHALESPDNGHTPGVTGDAVTLTINRSLQEICERALGEAMQRMGASGGDIVVIDPEDGSILALASRRPGAGADAATTLTEPFEPGSTLKPFIAAALIGRGLVTPTDMVDTHAGYLVLNGRKLTDTHYAPAMTLRDVIRWSSNVGIVQFAERLSPAQEYEALRDVGFGTTTGLPFGGESPGTLRDPGHWSKQSPASLAIGYEIAVTPLQLALAYGAIANGGELLEPVLVREIRAPDGSVVYQSRRRVVRRVMSDDVARQLRDILVETVARGTAREAKLPSFVVAGKTGTARRIQYGAGYGRNEYTASFVGLFPGRDPQYVILVKLDDPTSSFFGGATAAPVSRAILQAAIAARDAALDWQTLLDSREVALADTMPHVPAAADSDTARVDSVLTTAGSTLITLGSKPVEAPAPALASVRVPDVRGLPLRSAVRALHQAGLRVDVVSAALGSTVPASGTIVTAGSLVRLGDGSS